MDGEKYRFLSHVHIYGSSYRHWVYYVKRASQKQWYYLIGGRSIALDYSYGPEASDMSGWLLMDYGVAYWFGLSDAIWTLSDC